MSRLLAALVWSTCALSLPGCGEQAKCGDEGGPNGEGEGEGETEALLDPTQDCVAYLGCALATDADNAGLYEALYGAGGDCWVDEAEALACNQSCVAGLAAAELAEPEEPACWTDGSPTPLYIFPAPRTFVFDPGEDCEDHFDWTVTFEASADPEAFLMELEFVYGYRYIDATCTFAGHDYHCEHTGGYGYEELAVFGTFDAFFDAPTMTLEGTVGDEDISCTATGTPDD